MLKHGFGFRLLALAAALSLGLPAFSDDTTSSDDADAMPGVYVDQEAGYVELTGQMSPRLGDWLELVACFGPTREHESLVTVDARPSQIHLALVLLGLEPGKPLTWRREGDTQVVEPATGPAVEVFFVIDDETDPTGERIVPASAWIVDQKTDQPWQTNHWLFAGSYFVTWDDQTHYAADLNGTVISIVHFGDDLLAPADTVQTDQTDEQRWNAPQEGVPAAGTPVRIRLIPVKTDNPIEATPNP